jgi:hypothetical protein
VSLLPLSIVKEIAVTMCEELQESEVEDNDILDLVNEMIDKVYAPGANAIVVPTDLWTFVSRI